MFLMVRRCSDETDRRWRTPPSNSAAEEDGGVSACASGPSQATVGRRGGSGVHTVMRKGYMKGCRSLFYYIASNSKGESPSLSIKQRLMDLTKTLTRGQKVTNPSRFYVFLSFSSP